MLLVVGRSHTGKSQVLLNGIVSNLVNNPAAHVVIFSMDEPRELVVMKLYCLLRGKSSTEVEEAVKSGGQGSHRRPRTGSPRGTVPDSNRRRVHPVARHGRRVGRGA